MDPYGLSALAGFLPILQHLTINGSPSPGMLKHFGSTVTSLEFMTPYMHPSVVDSMHAALPQLRAVQVHKHMHEHPEVPQIFNFSKMMGLESLTVDGLFLNSTRVWASLPPNLLLLSCARLYTPPPPSLSLPRLRTLQLSDPECMLGALAGCFRAAPLLLLIKASFLNVNSELMSGDLLDQQDISSIVKDLILVNQKHADGVTMGPMSIVFDDCEDLQSILQDLPVLAAITKVSLDWVSVYTTAELLNLLCTVFPNLVTLEMSNSETVDDEMLLALLSLKKLQRLIIIRCPMVTAQSLTFLLCQLPITVLHCLDCEGVVEAQVHVLKSMMTVLDRRFILEFTQISESESE